MEPRDEDEAIADAVFKEGASFLRGLMAGQIALEITHTLAPEPEPAEPSGDDSLIGELRVYNPPVTRMRFVTVELAADAE